MPEHRLCVPRLPLSPVRRNLHNYTAGRKAERTLMPSNRPDKYLALVHPNLAAQLWRMEGQRRLGVRYGSAGKDTLYNTRHPPQASLTLKTSDHGVSVKSFPKV